MRGFKFAIVFLFLMVQTCTGQIEKINGVSFVASSKKINKQHVAPIVNINANYAAIMPFGFIRDLNNPKINYNTDRQWYGESKEGVKQYIIELKKEGVSIMMKPQIWVLRGEFTGLISMQNEKDWKTFEDSYSNFILDFAQLAEETNSEILCIGTELEQFIVNRPEFWNSLITKIKEVYKGKLTYAANWDEYKRTPFWKQLDYIGIDAYFPVSDNQTPTLQDCLKGWKQHKKMIKEYSVKNNIPILFTEFGYRSVDFTGKEPWKSDRKMTAVNLEAQTNTTHALFEEFWKEDWFAGGFVWKWHHDHEHSGGENNTQFTPQNKPVQALIKSYYSKK